MELSRIMPRPDERNVANLIGTKVFAWTRIPVWRARVVAKRGVLVGQDSGRIGIFDFSRDLMPESSIWF